MTSLEEIVAEKRNSLKTDRLDMSFGELMSMFEDGDLFITPEYQRVFRWQLFQQTRFIESVLLGIPIPPIFVAEDGTGKWRSLTDPAHIHNLWLLRSAKGPSLARTTRTYSR
ncbi:MAG: DUF262 domain-containing protein [Ahniella sp.]|nr:DUF262 domain-containing protein [Ahniella sp.]